MGQKIEIKPNDQSWVGKKIRKVDFTIDYCIPKFIGNIYVLSDCYVKDDNLQQIKLGGEEAFTIKTLGGNDWELYEEPGENKYGKTAMEDVLEAQYKYFKYKKIIDPDGIAAKEFEEITRPQGHHCTGKCTKLDNPVCKHEIPIPLSSDSINKFPPYECLKCGFKFKIEEKECEHEWESWDLDENREVKCRKCRPKKVEDPFWLKVGDVIRLKFKENIKIKDFKFGTDWYFTNNQNYKIISEPESFLLKFESTAPLEFDKKYFTSDKFKKIKLVSPAIYIDKLKFIKISEELYSSKPIMGSETKVIWPAKDQFGREIFFEVEE